MPEGSTMYKWPRLETRRSLVSLIAALPLGTMFAMHRTTPGWAQPAATQYLRHDAQSNGVFSYPWRKADTLTRQKIADLGWIDGKHRFDDSTIVSITRLPFYQSVQLVYARNEVWKPQDLYIFFLIDQKGRLYRLSGTSPPIHQVNAESAPTINEHTVRSYLWFFSFFVRGDEGPFLITESMSDTFVPKQVDRATHDAMRKHVRPSQLISHNDDQSFDVDAVVYYSNYLFAAKFNVDRTGNVKMVDDERLAGPFSVRISAPLS